MHSPSDAAGNRPATANSRRVPNPERSRRPLSGAYKVKSHYTMPEDQYQSSNKKTVTKLTFPAGSRPADKIGVPTQGSTSAKWKSPEGDSSIDGVEDTQLCVDCHAPQASPFHHPLHNIYAL